jgi:hypothetical protein
MGAYLVGDSGEIAKGKKKLVEKSSGEVIRFEVGSRHGASVGVKPWTCGVRWRRGMEPAHPQEEPKRFSIT